jgi:hypothetical protein
MKYRSTPTNGFGSKLESAVRDILRAREKAGEIRDIRCQQTIVLQEGARDQRITWRVDFAFEEAGATAYAEAKGFATRDYKLKLKLYKGTRKERLYIYGGSYQRPRLIEVVNE